MLNVIESRRSVRAYESTSIPEDLIQDLVNAVFCAPSANNKRPWHVVVVREPKLREMLAEATPWCAFIREAPVCVVVAADPSQSGDYWVEDCSAGMENLMIEAACHSLGTCWIGIRNAMRGSESAADYIRSVLEIPSNIEILAMTPIGIPADEPQSRDRTPEPGRVHWDRF